jgi:hypothetical protein
MLYSAYLLRKQLLCAFLSLIFLCGMMPCNISSGVHLTVVCWKSAEVEEEHVVSSFGLKGKLSRKSVPSNQ